MPGLDEINGEGLKGNEELVYISGPYTKGSWGSNVADAIDAAQIVYNFGDVPFIPHTMSALWSILYSNEWIKFDLKWLSVCDSIIRLDGYSEGADTEVEFAKEHGIKVYDDISEYVSDRVSTNGRED